MFSSVGILACLFVLWTTGQAGLARLLGRYALITADLSAANKGVALAPSDPESHTIRAAVLYHLNQLPDAAKELEAAVSLRPRDDYQWLKLAMLRDELKDTAGALTAFDQAVQLAPYYASPRWQRGNFLLRERRFDEAFADLRFAAASNPDLIPNVVDLAWGISGGNIKRTEQLVQITTNEQRIAFARFLARKGSGKDAVKQLGAAGTLSDQTRIELTRQLLSANAFQEAFEIWKKNLGADVLGSPAIYDGGFEGPISFEESGFGWNLSRPQGASLAADSSQPHTGAKSLSVQFSGDSNPDISLVSQLILVEPSRHYRIDFAARTQDIVTGGVPFAVVSDAGNERKRLGESETVRQNTTDWQIMSFDFRTEPTTKAVVLSIQRKNCTTYPCPIFGWMWLDSFSIQMK